MKLGDALLLFIVAVMVSILWISMGYSWVWVALMWVVCTGFNLIHARAEEYKKRMDVLKNIARINTMTTARLNEMADAGKNGGTLERHGGKI